MASTPPDQLGAVRILRDAAGIRTTYEELEIGKDLGSAEFLVTQGQIDQTCDRLEDHHPYYEVGSPFGSTVAPVWMTYLIPRMLFSQTYSVRGLFYKWGFELLGPVRPGVRHTVSATLTEKWIRNDREFVAYEAVCKDESGRVVYRSRRAHVLDFIKRTAPKVGEGAIGTSDARTPEARAAREQNWDRDWPHDGAGGERARRDGARMPDGDELLRAGLDPGGQSGPDDRAAELHGRLPACARSGQGARGAARRLGAPHLRCDGRRPARRDQGRGQRERAGLRIGARTSPLWEESLCLV